MTGPEHYREAERLLGRGINCGFGEEPDAAQVAYLAAAQVHATLALAAATATHPSGTGAVTISTDELWQEWRELVEPKRSAEGGPS